MSFKELVLKNRSYRRFFEDKKIEKNELGKSCNRQLRCHVITQLLYVAVTLLGSSVVVQLRNHVIAQL